MIEIILFLVIIHTFICLSALPCACANCQCPILTLLSAWIERGKDATSPAAKTSGLLVLINLKNKERNERKKHTLELHLIL